MTIGQYKVEMTARQAGFSMLDVLVAIVVLATGLLALAALQGAMTRNGVDSRARSQIAAYTQSVIDRMRFVGYDLAAPSTLFAQGDTITAGSSCQDGSVSLTTLQRLQSDAMCAQSAAGASNLTTTITTAQLYCGTSGSTFAAASACTPDQASYKQLKLTSTWTDSTGALRSMSFDTTLSPVTSTPTNNALTNSNFSTGLGSTPVVREANPGKTLGVIPIAVSSGSDAAATNPKPVISDTGTTFSTLTYVASNADLTTIQQRVDAKIIQCSCKFGSSNAVTADANLGTILQQPFGPTYWDGTQYVSPAKVPGATSSITGLDTSTTQDASCDICCRDRNDTVGNLDTSGNAVYFDNYDTSGRSSKYQYVTSGGTTTLQAVNSGTFGQACRMIRVDGVYAAATDAHLNFFNLLGTSNCAAESKPAPTGCTSSLDSSDTVPTGTTETNYANFVVDYLYNNFALASPPTSNTGTPAIVHTDPQHSDAASNLFTGTGSTYGGTLHTYALRAPNSAIALPNTVNRWVYARGIYVDHLETKATTALKNAITNCGATDEASISHCTLPVLPFTTVNMTELAFWQPNPATGIIHINNTGFPGGDASNPQRGLTTALGANGVANAVATSYVTNSGLTAINTALSTYDQATANSVKDQQQFTVTGGSSSGGGNTYYFTVALDQTSSHGLLWMTSQGVSQNVPNMSWNGTFDASNATATGSGQPNAYFSKQGSNYTWTYAGSTSSLPVPLSTTLSAPVGTTLTIANYNKGPNTTGDFTGTENNVTCYESDGTTVHATNQTFNNAGLCYNYAIDTANVAINGTKVTVATPTYTDDGGLGETGTLQIPAGISSTTNTIAGANAITIQFTKTTYLATGSKCTCKTTNCNGGNPYNYAPGTTCTP